MTRPTQHRTIASLIALSAVPFLSACAGESDAQKAVSEAQLEFRTASIGIGGVSETLSAEAFDKAESLSAPHAGSDAPYAEAAATTLAMAKIGKAALAERESSEAETESFHQARVIRAHLSEWLLMTSSAQAASSVDVSSETNSLRELIELRRADVAQYQALIDSMTNEIRGLESQIADLESRASAERESSAGYELQMTSVSATKAAELAQHVREHTLRADALELEAERVRGIVGQKRPSAKEVELQVNRANNQIRMLNDSIAELDQRVRDAREDAQTAKARADEAERAIRSLVSELETYRDEVANPASERVLRLAREAVRAARDASSTASSSGKIAAATAQQQIARALTRQAQGERDLAMLYQSIINAGLPGQWQPKHDTHTSTAEQLETDAKQAFLDAASSLRRVRARGPEGDALNAAADRIGALGGEEPESEETPEDDEG